ncbi:MAG: biopolymer transporter ExbD [Verrucomicrobiota bacterium]
MRFPRNSKIFRGQLDAAPLAGVFFLLVIFLLLASLVYTPGTPVQLPSSQNTIGVTGPTIAVAINAAGQFFFENQMMSEQQLKSRLTAAVSEARAPLTLVVMADNGVGYGVVVRITELAEQAGIKQAFLQQRPVAAQTLR